MSETTIEERAYSVARQAYCDADNTETVPQAVEIVQRALVAFGRTQRASALREAQKIATDYLFVEEIEEGIRALADTEERLASNE